MTAIGSDVRTVKFASERPKNDEDISCLLGEMVGPFWRILSIGSRKISVVSIDLLLQMAIERRSNNRKRYEMRDERSPIHPGSQFS